MDWHQNSLVIEYFLSNTCHFAPTFDQYYSSLLNLLGFLLQTNLWRSLVIFTRFASINHSSVRSLCTRLHKSWLTKWHAWCDWWSSNQAGICCKHELRPSDNQPLCALSLPSQKILDNTLQAVFIQTLKESRILMLTWFRSHLNLKGYKLS